MNTNRLSRLAVAALATVGVAASFLPTAQAQPPAPGRMAPPAGGRPGMGGMTPAQRKAMQDKMIAELHITPDQQAKLKKQQDAMRVKAQALMADKTMPDAQKQTKFKAMMVENRAKMNAIFTPAQQAKMQEMRKQAMQQMKTQAPPAAGH